MPKSYRPWTPTQSYLLPPSPLEWLPKDHLAYFGQIKQARGFRRFSMRGLAKSGFEWAFVCLAHNALKLFRALVKSLHPEPAGALEARSATDAAGGALLAA